MIVLCDWICVKCFLDAFCNFGILTTLPRAAMVSSYPPRGTIYKGYTFQGGTHRHTSTQ
nr:MAG TPA: hypothetical protein [Caudoviricetes sp.]